MTKARNRSPENKKLPSRWKKQHGAYYYRVPRGQESHWDGKQFFRLGKTEPEAYREWAARSEANNADIKTINQLLDRYELEIIPTKAVKTQNENRFYVKRLRSSFGDMPITALEPQHIYQYVDKRRKKVKVEKGKAQGGLSIAKREIWMFSDVFTKAVQWGFLKKHPFRGEIELDGEKSRTRYIENWELDAFMSLQPKRAKDPTLVIQAYTAIKILTGLRQQDLLNLKVSDMGEDFIHITPLKTKNSTGKSIEIEWTPKLREAVDYALSIRPVDISPYLFCTRRGESYYDASKADPASGWKSNWSRYMDRVLEKTKLDKHFTEHDLRAKVGSDLDDLEHARKLLNHSDSKITQRAYRRRPERVRPAG